MTDIKLIEKVAWLFYREDLNHSDIARLLGISRFKVARILDEAKEKNIIKVEIFLSDENNTKIQRQLEKKYSLSEVIIINSTNDQEKLKMSLGEACADYFLRVISSNMKIGVGFSSSVNAMVNFLPEISCDNCQVIQIIGGAFSDNNASESVATMPLRLANKINSPLFNISAPVVVNYAEVRKAILDEPIIKTGFEKFKDLDIAFVGLGGTNINCTLCSMGVIDPASHDQLVSKGAVGDINARFYDINGNRVITDLDNRLISMDLQTLKEVHRVVGVAGGQEKHKAILGALNGSYLDILITDSDTADFLIKQ